MVELFSNSLEDTKTKIKRCQKCNNLTEEDLCLICKDPSRDHKKICVVEDPRNIISFEKIGTYRGLYYVLNGLISPLEGITPEDINLDQLIQRIKEEEIEEVIFAVRPCVEGETTTLYISKILSGTKVKVSKIAHGVPIGADMEYVDPMTLETAFDNRIQVS